MPRIGLDITMLARQRTGVENYIGVLAEYLPPCGRELEFVYFSAEPVKQSFPNKVVSSPLASSYAMWRQCDLSRMLRDHKVDLFHSPLMAVPLNWSGLLVTTIHDTAWARYREAFSLRGRLGHRFWGRMAVRKSNRIIAPSQATAKDLARLYPSLAPKKTEVIPECLPQQMAVGSGAAGADEVLRRLQVTPPFLLATGTLHPLKNYPRLFAAFEKLPAMGAPRCQLVVVGRDGHGATGIHDAVRRSAAGADIRLLGYVAAQDLAALYQRATAFVHASYSEGFGLPLLEAMAAGVPVVTSNAAALPEVGGDAARYFDPRNVDEIAHALHEVLTDALLRAELVRKGVARAALFTAERMATATADLYRRVLVENVLLG